jgi:hypothetical protein
MEAAAAHEQRLGQHPPDQHGMQATHSRLLRAAELLVTVCAHAAYRSLSPWTSAYSRAAAGKLGGGTNAAASTRSCVDSRKHCMADTHICRVRLSTRSVGPHHRCDFFQLLLSSGCSSCLGLPRKESVCQLQHLLCLACWLPLTLRCTAFSPTEPGATLGCVAVVNTLQQHTTYHRK